MPGDWETNEKSDVIRSARSAFSVLQERVAALQAETTATAGSVAKERFGQFVTDAENALAVLKTLRIQAGTAGADAAALAKLDAAITAAQALCTAKRGVYAGNAFVVKLMPTATP